MGKNLWFYTAFSFDNLKQRKIDFNNKREITIYIRMKASQLFSLALIFLGFSSVFGQDYIVQLNHQTNSLFGQNLLIEEDKVKFQNESNGSTYELSISDVYNVKFIDNGRVEIIFQSFVLDTIECKIDSISARTIFYRQNNQLLKSIKISEVFEIYFQENQHIDDIERYQHAYFELHKALIPFNFKVVRKNGETTIFSKLSAIDSEKVYISLLSNGVEIKTFVAINEIEGIILKEPLNKKSLKSNQTFLLTNSNSWHSVKRIKNIENTSIGLSVLKNPNTTIDIVQEKSNIAAIFFQDFRSASKDNSANITISKANLPKHQFVKVDFNAGFGHLLAKTPAGFSPEAKKYIDEMRNGFFIDANFKFFPFKGIGFGVKYNQFKTSNSILSIVEDNIRVSFLGLSLTNSTKFKNNLGYAFADLSIGSVTEVNDAKLLNESVTIKGSTIGLYFSTGVEFMILKNLGLGFQVGLLGGKIDEIKRDGQTVELEEPDNLLRVDGTLGVKLYL